MGSLELQEENKATPTFRPVTAVDKVVIELNRICRSATFEFALSVGKLVVDRLYGGNLDAWRSRGTRDRSFAALTRRPELPMSPGALYRCVATYEICERLGAANRWKHVSSCHVRAVIGLPEEAQARLLDTAERQRWTVVQLENAAGSFRPASSPRGGRPRLPEIAKTARALSRFVDEKGNLGGAMSNIDELSPEQAREVFEAIGRLRLACDTLLPLIEGALLRATG
jgi:hypothetical protein